MDKETKDTSTLTGRTALGVLMRNNPLGVILKGQVADAEAASYICGGLLGECYIMSEIIDSILTDFTAKCKTRKWYRQTIKKNLRDAQRKLRENLSSARHHATSNGMLMRDVSDEYYDTLRPHITRFVLSVANEMGKHKVNDIDMAAHFSVIDALFTYAEIRYDRVIKYCNALFPMEYGVLYGYMKNENAHRSFRLALDEYGVTQVAADIDTSDMQSMRMGIKVFDRQINNLFNSGEITERLTEEYNDNKAVEIFDKAVERFKKKIS